MKLQRDIEKKILKWRRAYLKSFVVDFVAEILTITLLFFVILIVLDSLIYFQVRIRQALFFLFAGFFIYKTVKGIITLFYQLQFGNFSVRLSHKKPLLSKYIGPAIEFILRPTHLNKDASKVFVEEHLRQTGEKIKEIENIKFSPFDFKNFKAKLFGAIFLALCFAGLWLIKPFSSQRIVLPFSSDEFENILTISPQNKTIVENESVLIKVSSGKKLGSVPVLQLKEKGGGWISAPWDNQSLFDCSYNILNLKNDINYRLKYHSMKSREYQLKVRKYPQVKDISFVVRPPAYLKGKSNSYSYIPTQVSALEASTILVSANSSQRASKFVVRAKSVSNDRKINFLKN
ncbi:MAG: hypothetical protein KKD35_03515, partial [Elusimicrobia bacterium]|nr:hypothetical protein [Elusimicrobiota bacterium]